MAWRVHGKVVRIGKVYDHLCEIQGDAVRKYSRQLIILMSNILHWVTIIYWKRKNKTYLQIFYLSCYTKQSLLDVAIKVQKTVVGKFSQFRMIYGQKGFVMLKILLADKDLEFKAFSWIQGCAPNVTTFGNIWAGNILPKYYHFLRGHFGNIWGTPLYHWSVSF